MGMRHRLLAAAFTLVSATTSLNSPSRAEPYAFRGIELGTTLEDVRRIVFPEARAARILCTHDAEASDLRPGPDFVVPQAEAAAGVLVCGAFTFGKILGPDSRILPPEWIGARLRLARIEVKPTFWFLPAGGQDANDDAEAKLYRIAMLSNSVYWQETLSAFTRRYGPPTSVEPGTFPSTYGGSLDNLTVVWRNPESSITLVKRRELAQRLSILYEHTPLTATARGGIDDKGPGR